MTAVVSLLVVACCAGALVTVVRGGAVTSATEQPPAQVGSRATVDREAPAARTPSPSPQADAVRPERPDSTDRRWRAVLAGLDRRRARAYARAAPRLLRDVYQPGAAALRRDRALLLRYRRRGLRVEGLRMQVREMRVRDRDPARVVLEVSDRIAAGAAVGNGHRRWLGSAREHDHRIVLRRLPGTGWRIGAVQRTAVQRAAG